MCLVIIIPNSLSNCALTTTLSDFYRKIVSESRALVNGLDLNGLNEERSDVNDITDGQPFGPGSLGDWKRNNGAKVWPEPTSTDSLNNPSSPGEEKRNAVDEKGNSSNSAGDEKLNSSTSACEEDTNNSSSSGKEEIKLGKLKELKSDDEIREHTDSVLPKLATVTETNENQLVVKDCVVKSRTPLSALLSNESENETGNAEPIDTEHVISEQSQNQELTTDDNAISQQSEKSLDNESSHNSNSQSNVSVDSSTGKEKHSRELTDAVEDGPPEKKVKLCYETCMKT